MISCGTINFEDLINDGTAIDIHPEHISFSDKFDSGSEDDIYDEEEYKKFGENLCDEDCYQVGQEFDELEKTMHNLLPNGKIKKRIIRAGTGKQPQDHDLASIHYNAYGKFEMEPFDSTYNRNRMTKFVVNDGRTLVGLDFAVQSMQEGEKSEFLIHPEYAYGKNALRGGSTNNDILFQVELVEIVSCGAVAAYHNLPKEKQSEFGEVIKYCEGLCEQAKNYVVTRKTHLAIVDYNTAYYALKKVTPSNPTETKAHQELYLRCLTNLLVCYTKEKEHQKGCKIAQSIYEVTQNGEEIPICSKIFYNHAKCLRALGQLDEAKKYLNKALAKQPKNADIIQEVLNLERERDKDKEQQTQLAKALFKTTS